MERKNNIPLPGQGSVDNDPAADLFGKLDALNVQVNEILNDPVVRRMAIEVGIALLAKRYPALGALLGTFGDTGVKQTAVRRAAPTKRSRGIR